MYFVSFKLEVTVTVRKLFAKARKLIEQCEKNIETHFYFVIHSWTIWHCNWLIISMNSYIAMIQVTMLTQYWHAHMHLLFTCNDVYV